MKRFKLKKKQKKTKKTKKNKKKEIQLYFFSIFNLKT